MKIVLISNPVSHKHKPDFPPSGIAYLGAAAHRRGHEVLLIDGGLDSMIRIIDKVRNANPDIVGVTCWTIDRKMVWKLCELLKKTAPNTTLVLGGPHATLFPEHIFKKTHASVVVMGEGENTFAELIEALENGNDLKNIAGLALRNPDGSVFYTPGRAPIQNIDTIPYPYYEGFDNFSFSQYNGFKLLPGQTAAVISSRGCVFDCNYCSSVRFWGRQWRPRAAQNVLNEIEWLIDRHNIRSTYFFDDNFTVNRERAIDICNGIISRQWKLKWACCSHVKTVNKELLEVMKASGCVAIDFGVESGSNKILENINQKQTSLDIEKAFDLVHKAGISPRAYLMVGSPGEDVATIDQTVQLISRIKPASSTGASLLWLLPGTKIYEDALASGHISEDFWLDSDEVPFNQQEHSLQELESLRKRLMLGIVRAKGKISLRVTYNLKRIYYKYPGLSIFRSWVPKRFR